MALNGAATPDAFRLGRRSIQLFQGVWSFLVVVMEGDVVVGWVPNGGGGHFCFGC